MRLLCCFLFTSFINVAFSQTYFPVKVNQKWGLIDKTGSTIVSPEYDAIGDFYQYGYAIIQEEGKVGVMNKAGKIVVRVAYEDLQVLDSTLFAVVENDHWKVINLAGQAVLDDDYERVKIWQKSFLFFSKAPNQIEIRKIELIDSLGKHICNTKAHTYSKTKDLKGKDLILMPILSNYIPPKEFYKKYF